MGDPARPDEIIRPRVQLAAWQYVEIVCLFTRHSDVSSDVSPTGLPFPSSPDRATKARIVMVKKRFPSHSVEGLDGSDGSVYENVRKLSTWFVGI